MLIQSVLTSSAYDPWRRTHDAFQKSGPTLSDCLPSRPQRAARQHRLPALPGDRPHQWSHQGRMRCLFLGTDKVAGCCKKQRDRAQREEDSRHWLVDRGAFGYDDGVEE